MSFDITITVRRGLSLAEINEVLAALEAPFAVGDFRLDGAVDGAQPDWSKPFEGGCYQAFPLLPDLSFQIVGDASVQFDGSEYEIMTGSSGRDPEIATAVALAMARSSGKATIFFSKTGEEQKGKLTRLEREVREGLARLWRQLEAQAASVPEEVAAYRRPRPEDTAWTRFERVALREQPERAVASYLRERASRALSEGNDGEIDRLLAAVPAGPAPLEPLLDACQTAGRPDLARRVAAHLRPHLREHFLAAVGYVGFRAVLYVEFLAGLGEIPLDAELLAAARGRAGDAEMRALLEKLGSST